MNHHPCTQPMKKSLYFPTAFRGTGPTPQVRQFDGVHLVALRSRLELHDCIPLLSEFQFFFLLCHCDAGA